ncbi:MAG: SAM-dependent methyltransferase [Ignavibacteriaceae bacterium]|nr:SAM-dependent methyltransferase [Ignavibacteriaceae bacterium]
MKPNLYIVSTPIGNYEDITLRALRILKECDFIFREKFKEACRFWRQLVAQGYTWGINICND